MNTVRKLEFNPEYFKAEMSTKVYIEGFFKFECKCVLVQGTKMYTH